MDTKKCTSCCKEKSLDEFYDKKRSKVRADGSIHHWVGKYAKCKTCHDKIITSQRDKYSDYYKQYRKDNKEKISKRTKVWYVETKQKWWDIAATKVNLVCSKCGYDKHSAGLDFHHIDEGYKDTTIHKLMNGPAPNRDNIEVFMREIDKCVVLCATCHREEHAKYNFLEKIVPKVTEVMNK